LTSEGRTDTGDEVADDVVSRLGFDETGCAWENFTDRGAEIGVAGGFAGLLLLFGSWSNFFGADETRFG